MPAVHDRGGWPDDRPIDRSEHDLALWEQRTDAMMRLLSSPERGIIRVDELRRAIESLDPQQYETMSYYQRWLTALETLMVEKGIVTREELEQRSTLNAQGGSALNVERRTSPRAPGAR